MRRRLVVLLAALVTVLSAVPAASAGAGVLAQGQADKGDVGSLTAVSGAVSAGTSIHIDAAVMKSSDRVPIIIKLKDRSVASYRGDVAGFAATTPQLTGAVKLDADSLVVQRYTRYLAGKNAAFERKLEAAVDGAEVTRTFEVVIGGVAAVVPGTSIVEIAKMTDVEAIYEDTLNQMDTDTSPGFIGADHVWSDLGGQEVAGEGVVVGIIDSGIWPEHPSVSDPDPAGNPYPAPAIAPGSNGFVGTPNACNFGDTAYNSDDVAFTCNNKLIGAYDFTDTYKAVVGLIPTEFNSARDSNGHGTHTMTTAAGNGAVEATLLGVPRGTVSGIAPRAHVIAYKGCGLTGCYSSDTAASVAQAILDGVDVINYSISGGGNPYGDATSLAFLDAYNAGVLVNPSAGNAGPGADTVAHREPWTLTVGASTTDRQFQSTVTVTDGVDSLVLYGASVTAGISSPTDVVFPPAGQEMCNDPFAAGTFSGQIVICERGFIARVGKGFNVAAGGAGGMLLYNPTLQGLATDNHFLPAVHLESDAGSDLLDFMGAHTGVTATFTDGLAAPGQGDVMAAFSSRGGPGQTLGISKPDVTAPGVQILAGMTPLPENSDGGLPGELFQSIQGTSMSAPHSTGAAALMKALHPSWGPGEIKSALMMTAKQDGVTKEDGVTPADPFDFGSGRIDLAAAGASVTISETGTNYLAYEDHLWDANYPSLYIPVFAGQNVVERTFQNQTGRRQVYTFEIMAPSDLRVIFGTVVDGKFYKKRNGQFGVRPNGSATHHIKVDGRDMAIGETAHAWIKMTNKRSDETLVFPITVVRQQGDVTLDKTCAPADIELDAYTSCTITVQNNTFDTQTVNLADRLPKELRLKRNSVVGATRVKPNGTIRFISGLGGAAAPIPAVTVDNFASPLGYLPLAGFGSSLDAGATDESIANFGVPAFEYGGVLYDTIGVVSNGYIVVGGGTSADVDFINSDLPDAAAPNNVLAPFWTDLNPDFGGRVLVNVLSDGFDTWIVAEWEAVSNYGDGELNTFQVWIGVDGDANSGEDISFVYGSVSDGDSGFLTVGAENAFGTEGGTVYFDGAGTPPAPSYGGGNPACDAAWPNPPCYEVDVTSVPGAPGEIHEISFMARGRKVGNWTNYVWMTSSAFAGKSWATASGSVAD